MPYLFVLFHFLYVHYDREDVFFFVLLFIALVSTIYKYTEIVYDINTRRKYELQLTISFIIVIASAFMFGLLVGH